MRAGRWGRWRGGVGGLRTPSGCVCKDYTQYPDFALGTSEMAADVWPFCVLLLIFAPSLHLCNQFRPLQRLCIVSVKDVGLSACASTPSSHPASPSKSWSYFIPFHDFQPYSDSQSFHLGSHFFPALQSTIYWSALTIYTWLSTIGNSEPSFQN